MRTTSWATAALLALATLACRATDRGFSAGAPAVVSASASPSTIAAPGPSVTAVPTARDGDGRLPFEYPPVTTAAQVGDRVLAPPRPWIDTSIESGADQQPFAFFRAELLERGRTASIVATPSGRQEEIPNALLIPIRKGGRAKPGQVVLTDWQQGTGLQRAMVIEGGTPESPRVHYLDLRYKHPSGVGTGSEVLAPDSFRPLEKPGDVGTTAACRDGDRYRHYIIVHMARDRLIGLGFAGRLRVLKRDLCQFLDVTPKIDDTPLFVPVMGVYQLARVRHYEQEVGRVFVRYTTAGEDHEDVFGIINVTRELKP